jgi:hypothetical protein
LVNYGDYKFDATGDGCVEEVDCGEPFGSGDILLFEMGELGWLPPLSINGGVKEIGRMKFAIFYSKRSSDYSVFPRLIFVIVCVGMFGESSLYLE